MRSHRSKMRPSYAAQKRPSLAAFPPNRPSRPWLLRHDRSKVVLLALVTLALILYFFRVRNGHRNTYLEREPTGAPSVVIVTVTDPETHASGYLNHIRENREQYAALHGQTRDISQWTSVVADDCRLRDVHSPSVRLRHGWCA